MVASADWLVLLLVEETLSFPWPTSDIWVKYMLSEHTEAVEEVLKNNLINSYKNIMYSDQIHHHPAPATTPRRPMTPPSLISSFSPS